MVFDGLFFFLQERAFDARVYLVQLLAGLSRHRPLLLGSTLLIVRIKRLPDVCLAPKRVESLV